MRLRPKPNNRSRGSEVDLYRVGVKLFCDKGQEIPLVDFIGVFHRWIQTQAVPGLLIDVADYSHISEGPGIVLVAHEGNLAVDETRGRRGLLYYSKRPSSQSLDERLCIVTETVARAAALLAGDEELGGRLAFSGSELEVFSNDRLLAANDEAGRALLEPAVAELATHAYGEEGFRIEHLSQDPRERLAFVIHADRAVTVEELAEGAAAR